MVRMQQSSISKERDYLFLIFLVTSRQFRPAEKIRRKIKLNSIMISNYIEEHFKVRAITLGPLHLPTHPLMSLSHSSTIPSHHLPLVPPYTHIRTYTLADTTKGPPLEKQRITLEVSEPCAIQSEQKLLI